MYGEVANFVSLVSQGKKDRPTIEIEVLVEAWLSNTGHKDCKTIAISDSPETDCRAYSYAVGVKLLTHYHQVTK